MLHKIFLKNNTLQKKQNYTIIMITNKKTKIYQHVSHKVQIQQICFSLFQEQAELHEGTSPSIHVQDLLTCLAVIPRNLEGMNNRVLFKYLENLYYLKILIHK